MATWGSGEPGPMDGRLRSPPRSSTGPTVLPTQSHSGSRSRSSFPPWIMVSTSKQPNPETWRAWSQNPMVRSWRGQGWEGSGGVCELMGRRQCNHTGSSQRSEKSKDRPWNTHPLDSLRRGCPGLRLCSVFAGTWKNQHMGDPFSSHNSCTSPGGCCFTTFEHHKELHAGTDPGVTADLEECPPTVAMPPWTAPPGAALELDSTLQHLLPQLRHRGPA